jgi:hypothetical protein
MPERASRQLISAPFQRFASLGGSAKATSGASKTQAAITSERSMLSDLKVFRQIYLANM